MQKPRKPTDTYDIWDIQTLRADAVEKESSMLAMQDALDLEKEKLLARLTEINDLVDTIGEGLDACRKLKRHTENPNKHYMDFDAALTLLVTWRNTGKLNRNDARLGANDYRFNGEGRFDAPLCVKAVKSVGGTSEAQLKQGSEYWGIVEVPKPIAQWLEYCAIYAAGDIASS